MVLRVLRFPLRSGAGPRARCGVASYFKIKVCVQILRATLGEKLAGKRFQLRMEYSEILRRRLPGRAHFPRTGLLLSGRRGRIQAQKSSTTLMSGSILMRNQGILMRNQGILASGFPDFASGFPDFASGFPEFASGFPDFVSGFPDLSSGSNLLSA